MPLCMPFVSLINERADQRQNPLRAPLLATDIVSLKKKFLVYAKLFRVFCSDTKLAEESPTSLGSLREKRQ